jgi:hypothetical protein
MQQWIWRQFSIELPDDWEMLQFSREWKQGRCAFADRYQFRFELNWSVVAGPPDYERMLKDYANKLSDDGIKDIQQLQLDDWHGIQGREVSRQISYYGKYFAKDRTLAEVVLIWPNERDSEMEETIIRRFTYLDDNAKTIHWRAFNMDFRCDKSLEFAECSIQPANCVFTFRSRNGRKEQTFSRKGMAGEWLKMPIEQWIKDWGGNSFRRRAAKSETILGHNVFHITGEGQRRISDIFGGHRQIHIAGWQCPRDHRLYSGYSLFGSRNNDSDIRASMSCCSGMEVFL